MIRSDCEWYVRLAQQILDNAAAEDLSPRALFDTRPQDDIEAELACNVMQASKDLGDSIRELTEWLRQKEARGQGKAGRPKGRERIPKY